MLKHIGSGSGSGGVSVIAKSAVPASVSTGTAETVLATVEIPPLGPNDGIRITSLWTVTGNTNTKTTRIRLGGTGITGTIYFQAILALATQPQIRQSTEIHNRNSSSAQVGMAGFAPGGWGTANGVIVTSAVDTSAPVNLYFTGQTAVSGDVSALEYYVVELLRG